MCCILNFNSCHARVIKELLLQFFFFTIFHFSGTDKNCVNFVTYTCKWKLLTNFKSILFAQLIFHFWTKTQKMLTCLCICDSSLRFLTMKNFVSISAATSAILSHFSSVHETAQEPSDSEMLRYVGRGLWVSQICYPTWPVVFIIVRTRWSTRYP